VTYSGADDYERMEGTACFNNSPPEGEQGHMRQTIMLTLVGALLLAITASIAWAATINCGPGGNTPSGYCVGTPENDTMTGHIGSDIMEPAGGNDIARGKEGSDTFYEGSGSDRTEAGVGNDTVYEIDGSGADTIIGWDGADYILMGVDGAQDKITCGKGFDTVDASIEGADPNDLFSYDCESIIRP